MSVPFSLAALKTELTTDPAAIGYSPYLTAGNHTAVAGLLNAVGTAYAIYLPVSGDELLTWATANAVLINIDQAAAATGLYATGQSRAITTAAQNAARGVQYLLSGSYVQPVSGTLDVTDARIVGALSSGVPYTPGAGTVAVQGLIDILVAASVLVDSSDASLKDSLITAGKVACSRATYLWVYNATTNPTAPQGAVTVAPDQIAAALRS